MHPAERIKPGPYRAPYATLFPTLLADAAGVLLTAMEIVPAVRFYSRNRSYRILAGRLTGPDAAVLLWTADQWRDGAYLTYPGGALVLDNIAMFKCSRMAGAGGFSCIDSPVFGFSSYVDLSRLVKGQ